MLRVLGPLELGEVEPTTVGARKERAVLTVLALNLNHTVSVEQLIDIVWGEAPPATAITTLRSYVSRLRRALAGSEPRLRIEGRPGGYALVGPENDVDVACAEAALADVRAHLSSGEHAAADAGACELLGLWRGEPLAEFTFEDWAVRHLARLQELRVAALDCAVEARLARGMHHVVVPELEQLTADYPMHERFWAHRMLALYRCGRQTDALRVYNDARAVLAEEVGVEPGPELRALERAVLVQSPALDLEARVAVPEPAPPPPRIRFTSVDGVHIAYRTDGDGPAHLLVTAGGLFPIDALDGEPRLAHGIRRLAEHARVIHFDRRGVGMSDPVPTAEPPTIEQWSTDALAVLEANGVDAAAVMGWADGALVAIDLAARHPDRVTSLVIVNGFARHTATEDYTIGWSQEEMRAATETIVRPTDEGAGFDIVSLLAPSVATDPSFRLWWDRVGHQAASPATALALRAIAFEGDVRGLLSSVHVPTVVVHRRDNRGTPPALGRYLAEHIAGARYVELDGGDDPWWLGDVEPVIDVVRHIMNVG
jgi:DNA-binding SARP family transcriptional activator/pimeloyl-ACP methyl ester carboxylesterase